MYIKPFISFYDYTTSRQVTQEEKKNLTKKLSILNAYINFRLSKVSNSRREDGGIISGVIDYSEFTDPEEIVVIVYEDDEISPKVEIWENGYNPFNRNHRVEYRFTVPTGTFVNNYDFQGISPEN